MEGAVRTRASGSNGVRLRASGVGFGCDSRGDWSGGPNVSGGRRGGAREVPERTCGEPRAAAGFSHAGPATCSRKVFLERRGAAVMEHDRAGTSFTRKVLMM